MMSYNDVIYDLKQLFVICDGRVEKSFGTLCHALRHWTLIRRRDALCDMTHNVM